MHPNRQASSGGQSYGRGDYADREKQASGYDDALYPSFPGQQQAQEQPSAPFYGDVPQAQALPVHYNPNSAAPQQQRHAQYQYPTRPPPPPPAYQPLQLVPPSHSNYVERSWVSMLVRHVGFHLLNALLGLVGFILLIVGVPLSVGLAPLCCIGIVLFRGVLYTVGVLAKLDVKLLNFIAQPSNRVFTRQPLEPGVSGIVLAPRIGSVSGVSFLALLYFVSIKFVLAILSLLIVVLTATPLVVLGALLMEIFAKVSNRLTKHFCCEPFSTFAPPGYQQQARESAQQLTVKSVASYGSSSSAS